MSDPVIELMDLHHRYDDTPVLRGINLTIERGEVFGFLGHSGAGKTTAVNIMTTLIVPIPDLELSSISLSPVVVRLARGIRVMRDVWSKSDS